MQYPPPLVGDLYDGVDGHVHAAQYEGDEYTATAHAGYCVRCNTPDPTHSSPYVCDECLREAWQKAESYGGDKQAIEVRVSSYLTLWRSKFA